ncbi:predicted integrase [Alteracholeplasma palmae J233]|uniref:Predicted integrase n=1 Tax=Alteracholeplasma palmae (strain ATCC 49389 / J233) TaxID=1318466 RepID=U4KNK0_ALTPJ|nr:site-specific integrase [Alteracholeplasma palmae]CCV63770.1 predicted integrase [Alteracholeplasma palmae J233]
MYKASVFSYLIIHKPQDMALDYIIWNKENVSASTVNKRIVIVLKSIITHYNLDSNFSKVMQFKKMKELGLSYGTIENNILRKILKYTLSLPDNKRNGLMKKTAVVLLTYTGVRMNELINIEVKNIDFEKRELLLTTTKNGKARKTYIHDDAISILKKAVDDAIGKRRKLLLWNNTFNKPMTQKAVTYFIESLKIKFNLDKLHPHMFRHYFGTTLLDNGVNIKVVQELMDHKNLSTTQKYLHVNDRKKKELYLNNFKI